MRRRSLLPLASVVALAVAGVAVFVLRASDGTGSGSPDASSSAGVDRARCAASAEWRRALQGVEFDGGVPGELLLAVSSAGEIVAARDRDVRLLQPDGTARTIYVAPGTRQFERGYIDGHDVLVQLAAGVDSLERVVLIDTVTAEVRELAGAAVADLSGGRNVIVGAAMLGGHVYWTYRPDGALPQGTVIDYDIATGQKVTRARGAVGPVVLTAAGIEWSVDAGPPAEVPAELPAALAGEQVDPATVHTDGTAFAWADRNGVGWVAADAPDVVHSPVRAVASPLVEAVAGPLVVLREYDEAGPDYLLDTRTGALTATPIDQHALLASGGGLFVTGTPPPASTTPVPITVYDVRNLPELEC